MSRIMESLYAGFAVIGALLLSGHAATMELERLSDDELAGVSAQEGVSVRLELMINADEDGLPMTGGAGQSVDCNTDECRYGLQFAGLDEWLVFKGYSGILRINDIRLDAQPALSNVGQNPGFINEEKFQDNDGNCLLAGGDCSAAGVDSQPALQLSYPATTPSYNDDFNMSNGFDSLEIGIRLEGIAVEDNFTANAQEPFMGFNVRDVNSPTAGMAIGGEAYVFGF